MKLATKIMTILTVWLLYGGMITMAVIFDGIYIQICIDTAIVLITAIGTYIVKGSNSKQ